MVKLVQKPDDPFCLRASCGGTKDIGFYCVFRGKKSEIIECLQDILKALQSNQEVIPEDEEENL